MTKIENKNITKNPSGFSVVAREIKKDKLALASVIALAVFLIVVVIFNIYIRMTDLYNSYFDVNLLNIYLEPGEDGFLLGTDAGGHSVFGWLMMGTLNSILIAFCVTTIVVFIGVVIGLIVAYYGGTVDNIAMRFIDFLSILPFLMVIIALTSIIKSYNIVEFILILSMLSWMGTVRLVRSKALSESRRDYVLASKTMGTPDWKIMISNILPNISSIIIVEYILALVGNMGIEVSLSFLGFGLPAGTPSIGTLLSYARDADVLVNKMYIWLPAALVIFFIVMCVNAIGTALRRSLDARQRS